MKKLIVNFTLLLLGFTQTNAQKMLFSEMLYRPTDSSITVQSIFADSVQVYVEYGIVSGIYPYQTTPQLFADSVPANVLVQGLTPDTKYYYRMCYRLPNRGTYNIQQEHTFHTQRPPGATFTFDVEADPHDDYNSDTALYRLCLKNQLADAPDFMIDLGDFLMTDKLNNIHHIIPFDTISYRCQVFRNFYETECHSVPLFIALGNHEGEAMWNDTGGGNNIAVWDTRYREKYFLNPQPSNFYKGDTTHYPYIGLRESYYDWTWGDAQFIVLDPFWFINTKPDSTNTGEWLWTLGKTQYDWLQNVLDSSKATFKFVFAHQILGGGNGEGRGGVEWANYFEWGGENLDSSNGFTTYRPGWYKPTKDLLTEHHVNIFFHGHDHFFGEQEKECMIYQETPQPSLPNFVGDAAASYGYVSGLIIPNSGHLRVTVSDSSIKVEYVRVFEPADTNATQHNEEVSATYFIGKTNCYDSTLGVPTVIWNNNSINELVYPNPFMKQTTISFTLAQPERLTISMYDEKGKLVRTLLGGNTINAGKFDVVWDGNDGNGVPMPNGVYFYSIRSADCGVKSGKVVLVR